MCNNGGTNDDSANDTNDAIQEQYDTSDPDSFAEHWGIDTDSNELTPTENGDN